MPSRVPRSVLRLRWQGRWLIVVTIGALLVMIGALMVPLRIGWRLWAVGVVVLIPLWLVFLVRMLHLRMRVRREGCHLCPECEYRLRGEHSGKCPECGTRFHPSELPIVWSRALGMRTDRTAE